MLLAARFFAGEPACAGVEIQSNVVSSAEANAMIDTNEMLAEMKAVWDKLRAEGVPIERRPLAADLPWSVQFEFQAKGDPTGKDMKRRKAHEAKFADLE